MRLSNLEGRVFVGLVLGTTALFLWVVREFLQPVFWAAVFAVLFEPTFRRITPLVRGRRNLAAFVTTVTVILVVLIPLGLLVGAVARQGLALYQRVASGQVNFQAAIDYVNGSLPAINDLLARYGVDAERVRTSVETAALSVSQYLGGQVLGIGQDALRVAVMFALMLYFLFFFVRDGEKITEGMVRALPMGDERERRLLGKFAEVSRATVKGTLVVAIVQGTLGGVMFAIVGIQAPVFWGVVMGVLSLLPAVGAFLVWAPAAVYLLATGALWRGIFLIVAGTLVVGLVDNLLRPVLVGRQTKMPDYLVLLATLGGLTVFGVAGFVAGPIIAALFLVVWEMFADEYAPLDSSAPPALETAPADPAPELTRAKEGTGGDPGVA